MSKCKTHSRYQGKRKPKVDCDECFELWYRGKTNHAYKVEINIEMPPNYGDFVLSEEDIEECIENNIQNAEVLYRMRKNNPWWGEFSHPLEFLKCTIKCRKI